MSQPKECLQYAIGLSTTECACFTVDQPANTDTSESGLYLDRVDGLELKTLDATTDCETGNLWEMMDLARTEAIKEVKATLLQGIATLARLARQPWTGVIGDAIKFNKSHDPGTAKASFSVICADILSGYMKLKEIYLMFNATASFDITLYSNYQEDPIGTWTVTSLADKVKIFTLPEPLELQMSHPSVRDVQYWLVYDLGAGFLPKNSLISCGCGSIVPEWNPAYPVFYKGPATVAGKAIKERWAEFVMARGMQGNDIADRRSWAHTVESNGLAIGAVFGCRNEEVICKDTMDYTGNAYAMVLAYAILFKAAEKLVEKILATSKLNRYTLLDKERLWGKRNHYRAQHDSRQTWLAEQISQPEILNSLSDCFTCRNDEAGDFALAGIMS